MTSMTMTDSSKRAFSARLRMTAVVVCLVVLLGDCCGFQCYQCSYSYDPEAKSDNQDCIYSPDRIADVHINYHCDKRCYTQELYSVEKGRVDSIIRTCNWKNDSGYCIKDPLSITCYDSCAFDLCNNIKQPLHEVYPIRDSNIQTNDLSASSRPYSHHFLGAGFPLMMTVSGFTVMATVMRTAVTYLLV